MARPYITPPDVPTARVSRCLSFPDSLEWEALVSGFLAMGTRLENWQQLDEDSLTPEEAVEACVELLNAFFVSGECVDMTPVGTINIWPLSTAPENWLICDGQAVSRTTYEKLFAVWGETFGAGDGTTTFNLLNFEDHSPIGAGELAGVGEYIGAAQHVLSEDEMPFHSHDVNDPGHDHSITRYSGTAGTGVARSVWQNNANPLTPSPVTNASNTGISIAGAGGDQPFSIIHPAIGVHMIVYVGI